MLSKKWSIFSLSFYIVFGVVFTDYINRFHPYGNYVFDILFISFFIIKATSSLNFKGGYSPVSMVQYIIALSTGFATYKFAVNNQIPIPFNLNGVEVLLFLLLIGPILEEFIFRFCIHFLANSFGKSFLTVFVSAGLFSFSHLIVYFKVPESLTSFVIYQTIYTFIIGIWWSLAYLRTRSITVPIFLHIFFNLGFYLGSQFGLIKLS